MKNYIGSIVLFFFVSVLFLHLTYADDLSLRKEILTEYKRFDDYVRPDGLDGFLEAGNKDGYIEENQANRLPLWKRAAEAGIAEGQVLYGLHQMGMHNFGDAVKWCRKSAEQGNANGQYYLVLCSLAIKPDVKWLKDEGIGWLIKSAKQGNVGSQAMLGAFYLGGKVIDNDDREALMWIIKSANQGYADGQRMLGISYDEGIGGAIDKNKAILWYRKSAEQGNKKAKAALNELELVGTWTQCFKRDGKWVKSSNFEVARTLFVNPDARFFALIMKQKSSSSDSISPSRIENVLYDGTHWTFTSKFSAYGQFMGAPAKLDFKLKKLDKDAFEGTDSQGNPNKWVRER